ncbi:MAG: hypothetical protein IT210_00950 [Armatimonadetes bacterium]|nr:hypothetical protein [Armatimonadota bacterium]
MKTMHMLLLTITLIGVMASSAFAGVSREQALEKARRFLNTMGVTVSEALPEMNDSPMQRMTLGRHFIWRFIWSEAFVGIDSESGEILWFDAYKAAQARFDQGDIPPALSEAEAVRQAKAFARQMGLPVGETREDNAHLLPFSSASAEGSAAGIRSITFRRFYQGYPMPDYFSVSIEPYEQRVVNFLVNWKGMPICDTTVNLTEDEATKLAVDGLTARGIPAMRDSNEERNPPTAVKLMILCPNYYWTDYPGGAPFSRLAWIIGVARSDGSALGTVYIDAATGEWLGGGGVRSGQTVKLKSVPFQANAKAFLATRMARSKRVSLHRLPGHQTVAIQPQDQARWAALGALLATLPPLPRPPAGLGTERLTFTGEGQTWRLQQVGASVRLEGPGVPGGAIGFRAGQGFEEKLVRLAAPLAGGKKPPGK